MTHRARVLQALPMLAWLEAQLRERYEVERLPPAGPEREAFLAARGHEFEALVTSAAGGASNALLDALPRLRVVSSFGVGLDKIDPAHAARRGIPVGYTPDVLNDCVADLAFGLLIDIARRVSEGDRYVRAGRWAAQPPVAFPPGRRVSGARLGILGLGRIGRTIARRSAGFDMQVRYHARRPVADVPWTYEASLHALARWCDFLVVITAGGPQTRHLVDASVLDALGPQGFIVNVARGTVIDEAALVRALQEKRIAGAGLDVFANEPQVPPELLALDNVVMVPHIGSGTVQTRQAMGQLVLDNLQDFFATGQVRVAAPAA